MRLTWTDLKPEYVPDAGICAVAHRILCSQKEPDITTRHALVVGAFSFSSEESLLRLIGEAEKIIRARHMDCVPSWEKADSAHGGGYLSLVQAFLDSSACLSCVVLEQRDLPATGRCATVYRAYLEALEVWVADDEPVDIMLPSRFELVPCGGGSCRTVSVSGSSCPAATGRTPQREHAHLRLDDLTAVIGRVLSPRSQVAAPHLDDERYAIAFCLLDILLGAIGLDLAASDDAGSSSAVRGRLASLMHTAPAGKVRVADLKDGRQLLTAPTSLRHGDAELFDPDDLPEGELI